VQFGSLADVRSHFRRLDQDGDGTISKTELYAALTTHIRVEMTPAHMDAIWPLIDEDGSGAIEVPEFIRFLGRRGHAVTVTQKVCARALCGCVCVVDPPEAAL
jgi:Ca2+-binding EF-hand superfamily protein